MSVGKRIRAARERLEMTRAELATHFNITEQAIYEWEVKERRPDFDKLPKLARLLKVPLGWLIDGKGAPPSPNDPRVRIEALSDEKRAMLEQFLNFLEEQKPNVA
jgi:transcriptional regulator with XRE-family HTH domain